jgi:menaquinone-dependent protoporphyrinogen IX oxidase
MNNKILVTYASRIGSTAQIAEAICKSLTGNGEDTELLPVSEGLFAGRLDFSKLPWTLDTLLFRAIVALGILPRGDHRDWNAVHSWAQSLEPVLWP